MIRLFYTATIQRIEVTPVSALSDSLVPCANRLNDSTPAELSVVTSTPHRFTPALDERASTPVVPFAPLLVKSTPSSLPLLQPPATFQSQPSSVISASTLSAPFFSHVQSKLLITLPACSSRENSSASAQNIQRGFNVRKEDWLSTTPTRHWPKTSAQLHSSPAWSSPIPLPFLHGPAAFQSYSPHDGPSTQRVRRQRERNKRLGRHEDREYRPYSFGRSNCQQVIGTTQGRFIAASDPLTTHDTTPWPSQRSNRKTAQ